MGSYGDLRSDVIGTVSNPWHNGDEVASGKINTHAINCEMRADGEECLPGDEYGHAIFLYGYLKITQQDRGGIVVPFASRFRVAPDVDFKLKLDGNSTAATTVARVGSKGVGARVLEEPRPIIGDLPAPWGWYTDDPAYDSEAISVWADQITIFGFVCRFQVSATLFDYYAPVVRWTAGGV